MTIAAQTLNRIEYNKLLESQSSTSLRISLALHASREGETAKGKRERENGVVEEEATP